MNVKYEKDVPMITIKLLRETFENFEAVKLLCFCANRIISCRSFRNWLSLVIHSDL